MERAARSFMISEASMRSADEPGSYNSLIAADTHFTVAKSGCLCKWRVHRRRHSTGPHLVPHLGRTWAGKGDSMRLVAESGRPAMTSAHGRFAVR